MNYIVNLKDVNANDIELVGGKNASIGEHNRLNLAFRPENPTVICICIKRTISANLVTRKSVSLATFCAAPDSQTMQGAIPHVELSPAKEP